MAYQFQLSEMTIEEKLQMMEALWDDLSQNSDDLPSPAWHGKVLADREAALERGDQQFEDWEKARERIEKDIR